MRGARQWRPGQAAKRHAAQNHRQRAVPAVEPACWDRRREIAAVSLPRGVAASPRGEAAHHLGEAAAPRGVAAPPRGEAASPRAFGGSVCLRKRKDAMSER